MVGEEQSQLSTVDSEVWIKGLAKVLSLTDRKVEAGLRNTISSDMYGGKLALFLPSEMAELQPENLRYLHALASRNDLVLIEDRRSMRVQPIIEQRNQKPHKLARGIGQLLKQTGMPGKTPRPSSPHRLDPDNFKIPLPELIHMMAFCIDSCKSVVVLPNKPIVKATGKQTHPIASLACKVVSGKGSTTLCFFDSPEFKAIGYISNNQYVAHVILGGGPLRTPQLWANSDALTSNRFKFQLFRSTYPGQDFALLYNTFYLDLGKGSGQQSVSDTHKYSSP